MYENNAPTHLGVSQLWVRTSGTGNANKIPWSASYKVEKIRQRGPRTNHEGYQNRWLTE